jgi:hypothetical protein
VWCCEVCQNVNVSAAIATACESCGDPRPMKPKLVSAASIMKRNKPLELDDRAPVFRFVPGKGFVQVLAGEEVDTVDGR